MLRVFVIAGADPIALAHSLAALVSGAVLGHVARVTAHLARDLPAMRALVDAAGCDVSVGGEPAAALRRLQEASGGWWLVMRAGQSPIEGWSDIVMRHCLGGDGRAAIMLPARGVGSIAGAMLAGRLGRLSTSRHVLVLPPGAKPEKRGAQLGVAERAVILSAVYES